jgi:hypothetical protein
MSTLYELENMFVGGIGQARFVVEPDGDKFVIVRIAEETGERTVIDSYRRVENAAHAVKYLEANCKFPQRFMVSVRQTRRGDWLVFEALPATMGIGVAKVGSVGRGYKTGHQYGRFGTEAEANVEARRIADEKDGVVVAWEYPGQNTPFSALPRKYPTRTHYDTDEDAAADGWLYIFPDKTIEWYRGHLIYVQDITPGRAIDYELAVMVKGHDRIFTRNELTWIGGKFSWRFRTGDILDAIAAAHRFIDSLA